jgi:hypothetical protein
MKCGDILLFLIVVVGLLFGVWCVCPSVSDFVAWKTIVLASIQSKDFLGTSRYSSHFVDLGCNEFDGYGILFARALSLTLSFSFLLLFFFFPSLYVCWIHAYVCMHTLLKDEFY